MLSSLIPLKKMSVTLFTDDVFERSARLQPAAIASHILVKAVETPFELLPSVGNLMLPLPEESASPCKPVEAGDSFVLSCLQDSAIRTWAPE